MLFYSPAAVALILLPIASFLPLSAAEPILTSLIFLAFAMSIFAGFVFIMKWFRASGTERRMYYLTPVVVAMVVSSVLDLLADGGMLPGVAEAWTLWYAMVPVTLAFALTRINVNSVEAS